MQLEIDPSNEIPVNGASKGQADIRRGLIYTHNRANANTTEVHQASATLHSLVELLIENGVISEAELSERRQIAAKKLQQFYVSRGMAVAMQQFEESKNDFQGGAEIDCENRVHLCKAACCKLPLALTEEDVREGLVEWELAQPYMIAHEADGYCVHMDRRTHGCGIYEQRPIPCRGYDCQEDKRIWLDFDNGIVNPQIHEPNWPGCLEAETPMDGAS